MKRLILLSLTIIGLFIACEKDDICNDPNANTPHLIIDFYNISNSSEKKTVNNLLIVGNVNGTLISYGDPASRDQVSLPLRILENNTSFLLISDYSIDNNGTPDDDTDDIISGNPDTITLNYTNDQVYISRACGFKNIFNNLSIDVDTTSDSDNWIINTDVIQTTIENEQNAHIYIYH